MLTAAFHQTDASILERLAQLEKQNRRMKRIGSVLIFAFIACTALGFQAGSKKLTADELTADVINARTVFVPFTKGGGVRIDQQGITITAPGIQPANRINLTDHESRIEIGMDYEWSQDNFLRPTPRISVGRFGHDTARNVVTRAAVHSPEGIHSGQWHTNNPKHDGKTDRELIKELQ